MAVQGLGHHLPTNTAGYRTMGTNPQCQTLHQLTQPTPASCALPTAVSLKASKLVSDTWKAKINHRRVHPWGKPVALKNKEKVEHSHWQQQHGCYSMDAIPWMISCGILPLQSRICCMLLPKPQVGACQTLPMGWEHHSRQVTRTQHSSHLTATPSRLSQSRGFQLLSTTLV